MLYLLLEIQLPAQTYWTYRDCIVYALEHSQDVKMAALDLQKQQLIYRNQRNAILPGISESTGYGISVGKSIDPNTNNIINNQFFSNNYGISSSFMLFNNFRQYNRIIFEKYNLDIVKNELKQAENDLIYKVIESYTGCLLSSGLLAIQEEQRNLSVQELDRINKFIDQGLLPGSDLYDARARLAQDEFLLVQNKNSLKSKLHELKNLMNLPLDSVLNIIEPDEQIIRDQSMNHESIYQTTLKHNPGINILNKQVNAAHKQLQISRGSLYPSLSIYAGMSTGYYETSRDDLGFTIPFNKQFNNNQYKNYGISLRIPLFESFNRKNQIQLAKINEEIARTNLDKGLSILDYEIQDIVLQWESAVSEYQAIDTKLISELAAFEAAEKKREKGLISIMDYYESRNNLAKAKMELIRTRLQIFLSEQNIRFYMTGSFIN